MAAALVGLAFAPAGGLVVASAETVYRFDVPLRGLPRAYEGFTACFRTARADRLTHTPRCTSCSRANRSPTCRAASTASGRVLGAGDLIMLAIGAVIGAGIFGAIGTAAAGQIGPNGEVIRYGAGPALVLSFVLLGVACALAALCYAELASMIPQAGSAYAYSYATLGELVAWIIGWDLILEYAVGNIAVAISWGDYFNSLLRGVRPRRCRSG